MMEQIRERYELTIDRIGRIGTEETAGKTFQEFFRTTSEFILEIDRIRQMVEEGSWRSCSIEERKLRIESFMQTSCRKTMRAVMPIRLMQFQSLAKSMEGF